MAIWLRARKEFADNRFQLLFIYIDIDNIVQTVHGIPYTFSVKPKWRPVVFCFFAVRSSAEAYCARRPLKDTLRYGFQSAVEVSWRFGCVHARNSRTTVFNSSLYI